MGKIIDLVDLKDKRILINGIGEIIEEYSQKEREEASLNKAIGYVKKIEKEKHYKSHNQITDLFGQYIHYFYNECPDMERQYKVRFIRAAILVCGDEGYIKIGNTKSQHNIMDDKELMGWLKVSRRIFYETKEVFLKNNLIIKDVDGYRINTEIANKGVVGTKSEYIRIFAKGFNEIYENAKASEHKLIGNLIELIPYCNYKYNVLCYNPRETDPKAIRAFKMVEIAELLGYDKNSLTNLKKDMLRCTINGEYAFKGVLDNEDAKNVIFYINPALYYKGDGKKIEFLKEAFNIKS